MTPEQIDFDWNCLPKWAKWIAMDKNGIWFYYTLKPYIYMGNVNFWGGNINDNTHGYIHPKYAPKNFNGEWDKSLFKRPKK